ncbi:unnamed protein product, partial [Musa textilis]
GGSRKDTATLSGLRRCCVQRRSCACGPEEDGGASAERAHASSVGSSVSQASTSRRHRNRRTRRCHCCPVSLSLSLSLTSAIDSLLGVPRNMIRGLQVRRRRLGAR